MTNASILPGEPNGSRYFDSFLPNQVASSDPVIQLRQILASFRAIEAFVLDGPASSE